MTLAIRCIPCSAVDPCLPETWGDPATNRLNLCFCVPCITLPELCCCPWATPPDFGGHPLQIPPQNLEVTIATNPVNLVYEGVQFLIPIFAGAECISYDIQGVQISHPGQMACPFDVISNPTVTCQGTDIGGFRLDKILGNNELLWTPQISAPIAGSTCGTFDAPGGPWSDAEIRFQGAIVDNPAVPGTPDPDCLSPEVTLIAKLDPAWLAQFP